MKGKHFRAYFYRMMLNQVRFIGITGSAGKTTTTDLAAAVLSVSGPCQKTHAYSGPDAVAKMLLKTKKSHRYHVSELGVSGPGTLDLPLRLLKPHIAVITLIGRDHFRAFKSIDVIASEKEKVVQALPQGGVAVLNIDDPIVRSIGERCNRRIIWFGESTGATLRLLEARSRWPEPLILQIEYGGQTYEVPTQLHGVHMAIPVLAALGVALAADVPLEKATPALVQVAPPDGRMQIVKGHDGVVFIRDDLKAPGWSFQAPLEFLRDGQAIRKVAVVGTISDTSGDSGRLYKKFCRKAREFADLVVFVGPHAHRALRARYDDNDTTIQGFFSIRQAADYLHTELRPGDLVLLKGSHKADHLVRLILNRETSIKCWRDHCEKVIFCDACPKLYKAVPDDPFAKPMLSESWAIVPVVVGLGNPGIRYRSTLHNAGYRVLDALAEAGCMQWERQPEGLACQIELNGTVVHLLKPGVNMNENGTMVRRFIERIGSNPQGCFIVHDDADLSLGDVRFKPDGGDAGHRGVKSVILALGTGNFSRIRLGIRRVDDAGKAKRFVLRKFSPCEETDLGQMIQQAVTMIGDRLRLQRESKPVRPELRAH